MVKARPKGIFFGGPTHTARFTVSRKFFFDRSHDDDRLFVCMQIRIDFLYCWASLLSYLINLDFGWWIMREFLQVSALPVTSINRNDNVIIIFLNL